MWPDESRYLRLDNIMDLNVQADKLMTRGIPPALGFIAKWLSRGESVVVHCDKGVSRSCSIIIAWLMIAHNIHDYNQALKYVNDARPIAGPNAGFTKALKRICEDTTYEFRDRWIDTVRDNTENEVDFVSALIPS